MYIQCVLYIYFFNILDIFIIINYYYIYCASTHARCRSCDYFSVVNLLLLLLLLCVRRRAAAGSVQSVGSQLAGLRVGVQ